MGLGEAALEAVALHPLHAIARHAADEAAALRRRPCRRMSVHADFRLHEARLVEHGEGADVGAARLQRHEVLARAQAPGQIDFVHAEEAVGAVGRAVARERAVDIELIRRRSRRAQRDALARRKVDPRRKAAGEVLFPFPSRDPHGNRLFKKSHERSSYIYYRKFSA